MILWSLLILASNQIYAENLVTATITYDNKKKVIIGMQADTMDVKKMNKCVQIVGSNEGIKIIELQAKNKKEEIIKLKFICNL